ncbi:unnamed protein product [Ambrosiozyma monospora]|uniref:Unnamed protein product n=1 Tax=Ambrosiozyma monospora TaxID=43982 RepID=A0ACB5U8K9_AMBMO|nr:unnamed protein product [Ambrosiozyma monospora]
MIMKELSCGIDATKEDEPATSVEDTTDVDTLCMSLEGSHLNAIDAIDDIDDDITECDFASFSYQATPIEQDFFLPEFDQKQLDFEQKEKEPVADKANKSQLDSIFSVNSLVLETKDKQPQVSVAEQMKTHNQETVNAFDYDDSSKMLDCFHSSDKNKLFTVESKNAFEEDKDKWVSFLDNCKDFTLPSVFGRK